MTITDNHDALTHSKVNSVQEDLDSPFVGESISIPVMSSEPTEDEKAKWRNFVAGQFTSAGGYSAQHDTAIQLALAMTYIDWANNGAEKAAKEYYGKRIEELCLSTRGSKKPFAEAVVANLRLDLNAADPNAKKWATNQFQETATALEALHAVLSGEEGFTASYDMACVERVQAVIREKGGRSGLAKQARVQANDEEVKGIIKLVEPVATELAATRVKESLAHLGAADFVLAARMGNQLVQPPSLRFDQAKLDAVLASAVPSSPLLATLREVGQFADCITVEDIDKPKDRNADPKASNTEMRQTNAHVVLTSTGQVLIAPFCAQAGVVIRAALDTPLLRSQPENDVVMTPDVRKRLMSNLMTPIRLGVLDIEEVGPNPGTTTVYKTYKLSSLAARNEIYKPDGAGMLFSWKYASYDLAAGTHLPSIRKGLDRNSCGRIRIDANLGQSSFRSSIIGAADKLKGAARKGQAVECEVTADALAITAGKGDVIHCHVDEAKPTKFNVRADDLQNVLIGMGALEFSADAVVELSLEAEGALLRLAFRTLLGSYELFVPCCNASGTRMTHGFEPLKVTGRPVHGADDAR